MMQFGGKNRLYRVPKRRHFGTLVGSITVENQLFTIYRPTIISENKFIPIFVFLNIQ